MTNSYLSFPVLDFKNPKFVDNKYETAITFSGGCFDMARLYLSVMAYPERGACLPGRVGDVFCCALYDWAMWQYRKQYGRLDTVSRFAEIEGKVPERRQFQAVLSRGISRINRRMQVMDIFCQRFVCSLSSDVSRSDVFSEKVSSWGEVLNSDIQGWSEKLSINNVGVGRSDVKCKSKDLKRRAIYPSVPVIHMARGLMRGVQVASNHGEMVGGLGVYLSLLMCSKVWIHSALEAADDFQYVGSRCGFLGGLEAESMIRLNWKSA